MEREKEPITAQSRAENFGRIYPSLQCSSFENDLHNRSVYQRARFNAQNLPGISQKLLYKSAVAHGRIFDGIFLCMQLFVMAFDPFLTEHSRNILQVMQHPK